VEKDVLVQLFERRVLTYTPSNQAGWQVEMGNVGQHYHSWRYGGGGAGSPGTPGFYSFEGRCIDVSKVYLLSGSGSCSDYVRLCVASVEVRDDGYMKFTVTWTADLKGCSFDRVQVFHDRDSNRKYLVDNLGNRYDHVEVGETAYSGVILFHGSVRAGWYLFPPAQPGATSFTFHVPGYQIGGISFGQ
jgi:hypothetical protein